MKAQARASGFTLVELLVVIAVIAMLVAVVLPSMATSKDTGQSVMCLSNLRQLTAAWMTYTADNRGKLVPNGDEISQPSGPTDPNALPGGSLAQWCPGRQDLASQLSAANLPDAANVGYKWIELGLIYPYVGSVSAYHCPADTGNTLYFGTKYPHVRSVSMNTWLSPIVPYNNITTVESYYKDSDLVRPGPSQIFVFMDESPVNSQRPPAKPEA
jgi:prepilin-type N-terminal cleavage/methylation domain-containing protein